MNEREEFKLAEKLQVAVYRDRGLFYKQRNLYILALDEYNKSLNLAKELEDTSLPYAQQYEKSNCLLENCEQSQALTANNVLTAKYPEIERGFVQRINCYHALNNFEEALKQGYNISRQFPGSKKAKAFIDLIGDKTINESIGPTAGPCLYKMKNSVQKYHEAEMRKIEDLRPMWKQLREAGKCDVVSLQQAEKLEYSPLQTKLMAQKKQYRRSTYFGSNIAEDIRFLENLRTHKSIMLNHTKNTNTKIEKIIDQALKVTNDSEIKLWSRKPLYALRYKCDAGLKLMSKVSLFRAQESNRKTAFRYLNKVKEMEKEHFKEMLEFVENTVYPFFATRTEKNLLRKNEFMSDIYNTIGISYLNRMKVPCDLMLLQPEKRLSKLFDIKIKTETKGATEMKFTMNTKDFVDPEQTDTAYMTYLQKVEQHEKRLEYSRETTEQLYLLHEIGLLRLKYKKLNEVKVITKQMINIAERINNYVWLFHGRLMKAKIYKTQENLDFVHENLLDTKEVAKYLGEYVKHYIDTAILICEMDREKL